MAYGLNIKTSLKDTFALCFLFIADFYEHGYRSYHRNPVGSSYPLNYIPYKRTKKYLEAIANRPLSKGSTFYRLKKDKVFQVNEDKIEIDLNTSWWDEFLNYRFRFFSAPAKWDGKWTVLVYDIPEKHRLARDNFRQVITSIGFQCWQRSVWLTINPIADLIKDLLMQWKLTDFVTVFLSENLFNEKDEEIIDKLFEPKKLENKYKSFISKADYACKSKNKTQAREMINNFPNFIIEDTGLPSEFFRDKSIRSKVLQSHKQLLSLLLRST